MVIIKLFAGSVYPLFGGQDRQIGVDHENW